MTSQQHPDPPRLSLRVRMWGTTGWAGEGHTYRGSIVLDPGDAGYDRFYEEAVQALHGEGRPMPYATPADGKNRR